MPQDTDLKRAFDTLEKKKKPYDTFWNYYDGKHPLVYSLKRLQEIFRDKQARFSLNIAAVVVDSTLERINLKRFDVADNDAVTQRLNELFTSTEMHLDAHDAHLSALVTGEAFVIVWKNSDDETEAYFNDARLCHIFYDEENPRTPSFAAKWWVDGDEKLRMNLYYVDRIEYYVTEKKAENAKTYKALKPANPARAENPFERIPVFPLRRERRVVKGELTNVIEPQNAINKLIADSMVSAEFAAFKQRWIISNADVENLKNSPGEVWDIPAGEGQGQATQVGEFSETTLSNYWSTIDNIVTKIGIITRTPKHFFFAQGGDPSGEALAAMEAPINKKSEHVIDNFTVGWRDIAHFMLEVDGQKIDKKDIMPIFANVHTVQPLTQAMIRETNVRAGVPLRTHLKRDEGWSDEEIESLDEDKAAEQAAQTAGIAEALLNREREFDSGKEPVPTNANGGPAS